MSKIDIFGDGRKTPKLHINMKIRINEQDPAIIHTWNTVFGYFMKKPRTKLEFLAVNPIRNMTLSMVTLADIRDYLSEEDYLQLSRVETLFDKNLTNDVKAFILAVCKIKKPSLEQIIQAKS